MNNRMRQTFNDRLSLIVRNMNDSETFLNQYVVYQNKSTGTSAIYSNAPTIMSEITKLDNEFGVSGITHSDFPECQTRIGLVDYRESR